MYYSNGNYEAFARPMRPKDADKKSAYLVGSGMASLAAAVFLIRDGGVDGKKIHILYWFLYLCSVIALPLSFVCIVAARL